MTVQENKPEIHLLITKAKITGIELRENYYSCDKSPVLRANIALMVGDKSLTTMTLSSDCNENTPQYIRLPAEVVKIYDRLIKIVQDQANMSLEKIQLTLSDVPEAEVTK